MTALAVSIDQAAASGDVALNATLWIRHLRAANLSPATVTSYGQSVSRLTAFLEEHGMPTAVAGIRREHVEAFVEDLLDRQSPATAANRHSGLQAFFRWLVDEGEISGSPMARTVKPKVPEAPQLIPSAEQLRALLAGAAGGTFDARRDRAILRLFVATGARLSEVAGLRIDDVDLERGVIQVLGKGRRWRTVDVGREGSLALRRYVRIRASQPSAGLPWLWIGPKGRLTASGISQMVRRRAIAAGSPGIHVHLFRHAWAHAMLGAGGLSEGDVMTLGGWRSRDMLSRYAAASRSERALAAARRFNPGDRL
jgi:site-specific recombinase XerD